MISIKRIYEEPAPEDGYRVLVDKIWPRGVSKEKAKLDYWAKEITPSTELRVFFGHNPDKFGVFSDKYILELETNEASADFIRLLKNKMKEGNITLLYSARDINANQAVVLKEWVNTKLI